ncbi:MAG: hypothetical protein SWJ54_19235 [Cyanobacteriota bacterium]|nr:hypothetical protein [Cyanobacteriota bacterium]
MSKSSPSNRTFPPVIFPGGEGIKRNIDNTLILFPEPDSPTIPRVSPALTV